MALSEKDRAQLLDERLDPRRLNLSCPLHNYYGPIGRNDQFQGARIVPIRMREHPAIGCADCIRIYYIFDVLSVPPSERAQRFEELEEVMLKMLEKADKGDFDFVAFRHPIVSYDET